MRALDDHLDCTVKKSVNEAVSERTAQPHGRMTHWESRLRVVREKWGKKIVQLEPESVEGTVIAFERWTRMSVQTGLDNKLFDRVERKESRRTK